MNHELSASNSILFGSLRPWSNENQDEEKFRHLLNQNVRKQKNNVVPFFTELINAYNKTGIALEIENAKEFSDLAKIPADAEIIGKIAPLERPSFFNKQTEFYAYLIRNEYLGTIIYVYDFANTKSEIDVRYLILKIFRKIESILARINEVSHTDKSTVFIFEILKINLYFIHQELQRLFSEHVDFEILSENELIYLVSPDFMDKKNVPSNIAYFINQYKTSRQLILQAEVESVESKEISVAVTPKITFITRQTDFRGIGKSPVYYEDIKDVVAFSKFEEELFFSKIIDEDYKFIDHKGNKNMLAALYRILITKNYFRRNSFRHQKSFEPHHFRQYLDFRYQVDTSQQFRKCTDSDIKNFKDKHTWIDNIPFCR